MTDLRLHLIGGFELEIDGARVRGLQPGAQRLVAFVALTPRGVQRDFAAFQLWPDACEERARGNLRSSLWRIRKAAPALLETSDARLRLADQVWVDVRDGWGEAMLHDPGWGGPRPFETLLAHLLPDWYDDWLEVEREKLRQLALGQLEARARDAILAGHPAEAIQLALSAMAIDPLRESPYRLVAEAHLLEGNERDAQHTMASYRERCRAEAVVGPPVATPRPRARSVPALAG